MNSSSPEIYIPTSIGAAAMAELDAVPWSTLQHAYGTGKVGPEIHEDVVMTLRMLAKSDEEDFMEGVNALFSNLCHQGTIYEATAHAVPFVAALVAGADLDEERALYFVSIFGEIAIAASFEAPHGSHAGSHGPGVAARTRAALRKSEPLLTSAADRNVTLRALVAKLIEAMQSEPPSRTTLEQLRGLYDPQV